MKKIKVYLYALLLVLIIISLPTAFYFLDKTQTLFENGATVENSSTIASFAGQNSGWQKFLIDLRPQNPSEQNLILNFIYFYAYNISLLIIILAVGGLYLIVKYRQLYGLLFLYLTIAIASLISYFLAATLPFAFLISYERGNYIDRILIITVLFLLPLILIFIYGVIDRIMKQKYCLRLAFLLFGLILITASLYVSYPRFDRYFNSRGYATSQNDIEAVRWIAKDAPSNYIVLANQQVSAAALREFGFNKYYKIADGRRQTEEKNDKIIKEIFYYPVPTGGPLYQYYLDMVYDYPSAATMAKAMDLVGVKIGYFVLNKYWWAFPKILAEAKLEATDWLEFGNGEIYVFKYRK